MTKYEQLLQSAYDNNIEIYENWSFNSKKIKGLYSDNIIALNKSLENSNERTCILAEEMGHHYTTAGIILDTNNLNNQKQEHTARIWAYNKVIGLQGIIDAYKAKCRNSFEVAEFLNVSEVFLNNTIEYYKSKYGTKTILDNYIIGFEPNLYVLELYK